MIWHTTEKNPRLYRITKHGGGCIGSIVHDESGKWLVEIVLPPDVDITADFGTHEMALAFVFGVEKTFSALQKP